MFAGVLVQEPHSLSSLQLEVWSCITMAQWLSAITRPKISIFRDFLWVSPTELIDWFHAISQKVLFINAAKTQSVQSICYSFLLRTVYSVLALSPRHAISCNSMFTISHYRLLGAL